MTAFEDSHFLVEARKALTLALGLQNSTTANISTADVQAAFSACASVPSNQLSCQEGYTYLSHIVTSSVRINRFDYALNGITSQWCTLMTESLIVSADYLDDLKAFYELGAGHAINYEMAAVLLQDVFAGLRGRINETNDLHNIINFAHAETTLPLITLLGYTDRSILTASANLTEIEARDFRTSVSAPFGANVEFRLFQRKSNEDQFFVQVLVNEQEDEIPGCGDVYCDLAKVERLWSSYLEEIDFKALCAVQERLVL